MLFRSLHSLLKLPVHGPLVLLSPHDLAAMQTELKKIKILIIDEKSYLDLLTLARVFKRLREVFPDRVTAQYDWPIAVVLVGDLRQLPPVGGVPLYNHLISQDNIEVNLGRLLYRHFDRFSFIFSTQMRQAEDPTFAGQLARCSDGELTEEDWENWRQQSFAGMNPRQQESFDSAMLLAARNERDRKSTRLNSSHSQQSRMPSSA